MIADLAEALNIIVAKYSSQNHGLLEAGNTYKIM